MKKTIKSLTLLLLLNACMSLPHSEGREEYFNMIEKHSAGDKQFAGIYHNFEFRATLLNRDVTKAVQNRLDLYYDNDKAEASAELQTQMSELDHSTKFWLSFFTTERKNDNLANKVSIWKIYLVTNGKRFEGKAIKANKNFSEAQALFDYHTRWATAYYLEFPISTDEVGPLAKLIITGPLGKREVNFNTN